MYTWQTGGDERVRPSHALMDGKLCRWDDATVYSEDGGKTWVARPSKAVMLHPGYDYQCRCTALAYFKELLGEARADNADGFVKGNQERAEHGRFGRKIGGGMTVAERSSDAARALFPTETWTRVCRGVFVAEGRTPRNKQQRRIFDSDIDMAKMLAKKKHVVYLLPELGGGKHPDAIVDGELTEFKRVTGGRNAISHRFRDSLKQAKNVFLNVEVDVTASEVRTILRGVISGKTTSGIVYVAIAHEKGNILHKWQMQSLK